MSEERILYRRSGAQGRFAGASDHGGGRRRLRGGGAVRAPGLEREERRPAEDHLLGECGITFFAHPKLGHLRKGFPRSLNGQPLLVPMEGAPLRRALNAWLESNELRPRIAAEFEDSALLKVFGADGVGVFPAPTAVERQVRAQYRVVPIGRADDIVERFYVITAERRIRNPAVMAISSAARSGVFR